jgi:hypothetical protein
MRTLLSSCGVGLAFIGCIALARWISIQSAQHDPIGAAMVSGGLFTIAIAVLIRD